MQPTPIRLTGSGFGELFERMVDNVGTVLKGKEDVVRLSLTALLWWMAFRG